MAPKATTQQAIKTIEGGRAAVINDAPVPDLQDDFILAETKAVAINPTDWAHMASLAKPGSTLGCDWAGIVIKIGENVTKFKPGDEVFGACHGGSNDNLDSGAFARFIVADQIATYHKPAIMSFEEAASLAVGIATVGQSVFYHGGLALPTNITSDNAPQKDVFIYGGSSATGTMAIQFAKLSNYRVLTTTSPHNFSLAIFHGADRVFDYRDPSSIQAIQAISDDNITFILDCIGDEPSAKFCAQILSTQHGGHYHSVPFPLQSTFKQLRPESSVKATSALAYTMLGRPFSLRDRTVIGVDEKETKFVREWYGVVEGLLAEGVLRSHPVDVKTGGGLEGVLEGIKEMMVKGAPSGRKMVYRMDWSQSET